MSWFSVFVFQGYFYLFSQSRHPQDSEEHRSRLLSLIEDQKQQRYRHWYVSGLGDDVSTHAPHNRVGSDDSVSFK